MKFSEQSVNANQSLAPPPHLIPANQEQDTIPELASAAPPQGVDSEVGTQPALTNAPIDSVNSSHTFTSAGESALFCFQSGHRVVPFDPASKCPAMGFGEWIDGLSEEKVISHWEQYPDHGVGCIVDADSIVFSADGPKASGAIREIENAHRVVPKMVVTATKGIQHFFRRTAGTRTASDSHGTDKQPDRIVVKTEHKVVMLPSCASYRVFQRQAGSADDFTEVGQAFIDAIEQYNASIAEVATHADADPVAPIATPAPAGPTLSPKAPSEGGKGGEGGVRADPVPAGTALTPFTAPAGQSSQKCSPDSDPPAATPAALDSTFPPNAPIEGGEGGVQATATPPTAGTLSKTAPSEGGEAGEGGVLPFSKTGTGASESTGLQEVALVAAPSPIAANDTFGFAGDDDDVLTPKAANNPVITALGTVGLYLTPLGSGQHAISCPWALEHGGATGLPTVYFEPDEVHSTGGFRCPHEHRERHTTKDLLEFLGVANSEARHKPVIRVVAGELHRVVAAAERVLEERASYFQSGGLIVSIATDPTTGDPRILPASVQALTSALSAAAIFEKVDGRSGGWVTCDPQNRHVSILFKQQHYRCLSPLAGLARQPYFRETDGVLVTQPGYDKASQRFGVFDPHQFVIPEPTREAALAALARLQDLLCEVRFAHEHDKSAALSAMFTATVRPSLPQAPGFHVTSVTYGSGKSYLCKVICAFSGPAESVKISFATTSEEATKSLMAVLVKNPAVIEFDDMTTDWIAHGIVNRMLTSENLTDRILGYSKTATVSTRTLFLSSGNNVGPVGDLLRRIVTIHIDPRCETPTTIKYSGSPAEAVRQNRAAYVAAVLTIILAWRHAGSPRAAVSPIASYGGVWADYCRHPLIWLGLPDPAISLLEQVTHDPDSAALGVLLTAWHKVFGSRPTTVRKAISEACEGKEGLKAAIDEFAMVDRGAVSPTKLGQLLKKNANRLVGGYRFERATADGRTAWAAVCVGTPPSPPLPPSPGAAAKSVTPTSGGSLDLDPPDDY